MQQYKMEVSKKENGQYNKVGEVIVFYPLLSDLGMAADRAKDDKGADKSDDDGLPLYADENAQYIFDCVFAAVKAAARNKLVSGTATLKDGQKIAETVEELRAVGGGNRGEALAIQRECLAALKAYLPTTGKSQTVQEIILTLAAKTEALVLSTPQRKQNFLSVLGSFAESLTPEQAARFARPLMKMEEAANVEAAAEDF